MAVQNVCHCINPPGGQGQCEPDQLAICRATGGQCITRCCSPPTDVSALDERLAWALTEITGHDYAPPLDTKAMDILHRRAYVDPSTGEHVTFVLPQTWGKGGGSSSSSAPGTPSSGGAHYEQALVQKVEYQKS